MLLQKGTRLVMIGDSITDCGRAQPIGQGRGALGNGYVNLVQAILTASHPEASIHVINVGTSGHQVPHLQKRWQSDVLDLHPDWLSIMIGINDVWRIYDSPNQPEQHVSLSTYTEILEQLVKDTRPTLKGLVLMTPYIIESNRQDPMRITMQAYAGVVKSLASKYDAVFVDTQAAFDQVLQYMHPYNLAWDRIHPDTAGHMILARAFLHALQADA